MTPEKLANLLLRCQFSPREDWFTAFGEARDESAKRLAAAAAEALPLFSFVAPQVSRRRVNGMDVAYIYPVVKKNWRVEMPRIRPMLRSLWELGEDDAGAVYSSLGRATGRYKILIPDNRFSNDWHFRATVKFLACLTLAEIDEWERLGAQAPLPASD